MYNTAITAMMSNNTTETAGQDIVAAFDGPYGTIELTYTCTNGPVRRGQHIRVTSGKLKGLRGRVARIGREWPGMLETCEAVTASRKTRQKAAD